MQIRFQNLALLTSFQYDLTTIQEWHTFYRADPVCRKHHRAVTIHVKTAEQQNRSFILETCSFGRPFVATSVSSQWHQKIQQQQQPMTTEESIGQRRLKMSASVVADCSTETVTTKATRHTKAKKAYNTCIALQAAYRSRRGAVHVTDRASVDDICRGLSLRPQADLWPTSHMQPGLPFNGLHPRNPFNLHGLLLIYRPRKDGRLSWPRWLTHSGHLTHEVVTCKP